MKVEIERALPLTMVYIHLRNYNGRTADSISNVRGQLLFDVDENWIGLKVFSEKMNREEFELPEVSGIDNKNVILSEDDKEIIIFFDEECEISRKEDELIYINYDEDGVYGFEIILKSDDVKIDRIRHLISNF